MQLKNSKKIFLTLTFYFHKNIWIHIILLFLVNSFILVGLTGLFSAFNQHVFISNFISLLGLSLFLTIIEHIIKSSVSTQIYQLMMRSFGMGTTLIVIFSTLLYAMLIQAFRISSVEGLIGISFLHIYLRYHIRGFIVFKQVSKKRVK